MREWDLFENYLSACKRSVDILERDVEKLSRIFLLESYEALYYEEKVLIDSMLHRFAILQELLVKALKLYFFLEGYSTEDMTPLDIVNLAEKRGIVSSAEQWLTLRRLRNAVVHEYSLSDKELVDALNNIYQKASVVPETCKNLELETVELKAKLFGDNFRQM